MIERVKGLRRGKKEFEVLIGKLNESMHEAIKERIYEISFKHFFPKKYYVIPNAEDKVGAFAKEVHEVCVSPFQKYISDFSVVSSQDFIAECVIDSILNSIYSYILLHRVEINKQGGILLVKSMTIFPI